jgi:succinoglycan biosynthesis transport protein ExoP
MSQFPEGDAPQDLRDYLSILWARKPVILALIAVVVGAAFLYTSRQTPRYLSTTQILVEPVRSPLSTFVPQVNMKNEQTVAISPVVERIAAQEIGQDPNSLGSLSVSVPTDTSILVLQFSSTDPSKAQKAAQAYADAYLDYRREQAIADLNDASTSISEQVANAKEELRRTQDELTRASEDSPLIGTLQAKANSLTTQLSVLEQQLVQLGVSDSLRVGQIVQPASLPSSPATPSYPKSIALAVIVGLVLGVSSAFILEKLDDRVRGRNELEQVLGAPVLAVVPRIRSWRKKDHAFLATTREPHSMAAEAFRTLRTGVLFAASQRDIGVILVTSAGPQEGKSATCANLGVVLAKAGKRVVVVTADLRRPRLGDFLEQDRRMGLTNVLAGEVKLGSTLCATPIKNLQLLPSGSLPVNPAELLGSEAMQKVLVELREEFDLVLIDTAPVLTTADPLTLVPFVDGVLLVVDLRRTPTSDIVQARTELQHVQAPLIGGVMNDFEFSRANSNYPLYYSHAAKSEAAHVKGSKRPRLALAGWKVSFRTPKKRASSSDVDR